MLTSFYLWWFIFIYWFDFRHDLYRKTILKIKKSEDVTYNPYWNYSDYIIWIGIKIRERSPIELFCKFNKFQDHNGGILEFNTLYKWYTRYRLVTGSSLTNDRYAATLSLHSLLSHSHYASNEALRTAKFPLQKFEIVFLPKYVFSLVL